MDPTSSVTSTTSVLALSEDVEVPPEQFSILTAMMDSVPDILVDNVLADLEFRDVFTFKCVSHRCEDIVLSNINRLKKPEKIAVHIKWADWKVLTIGHREGRTLRVPKGNAFSVVSSMMNVDPANSWREGSMLFTKSHSYGEAFIEVSGIGVVPFLLKKFLPRMLVSGIYYENDELEKEDFIMISETHAVTENLHIDVNCRGPLLNEAIKPIFDIEGLTSITLRWAFFNNPIPKNFFESMKSIVEISLIDTDYPIFPAPATEFDNELLLTTLPQLKKLHIGKSNVTAAGLNKLLKQYLDGVRSFDSIELKLHHPNESITPEALWTVLVEGIPWTDCNKRFRSRDNERSVGMHFKYPSGDGRWVTFFTDKTACPRCSSRPDRRVKVSFEDSLDEEDPPSDDSGDSDSDNNNHEDEDYDYEVGDNTTQEW